MHKKLYGFDSKQTKEVIFHERGPNLFFKYFYFLFGPGLFNPLRVPAKVQIKLPKKFEP